MCLALFETLLEKKPGKGKNSHGIAECPHTRKRVIVLDTETTGLW